MNTLQRLRLGGRVRLYALAPMLIMAMAACHRK